MSSDNDYETGDSIETEDDYEAVAQRLKLEGATMPGGGEATSVIALGDGEDGEFGLYDPSEIDAFDSVREDGDVVRSEPVDAEPNSRVAAAWVEEHLFPALEDGEAHFGISRGHSPGAQTTAGPDADLLDTIRENYEDHGFTDGDQVVSLASPGGRRLGYITGSHVAGLQWESLESVDDYREAVAAALEVSGLEPGDVPIAPDQLADKFDEWGAEGAQEAGE